VGGPKLNVEWRVFLARILVVWLAALLLAGPAGAAPRRVLHVSLYPYIPDAKAAALSLKQGFEREHPDVIVDIALNPNYYSQDPAAKGVLYEDADVHEIDVVFLGDFLARHKLAPLSPAFTASLGRLAPLADRAARVGGRLVAVPQWMCTDFLIYRADKSALGQAKTLSDLEQVLRSDHGLLMDMKGDDTLGEFYLSALLAKDGSAEAAVSDITPAPDPAILSRLRRILTLEPEGFGRDPDYDARGVFYARQFARRAGAAFVGYSEMTHEVLDEAAVSCRREDRCVTASDVRVAAFPFEDGVVRPAVWVDMFGIDSRVHGETLADAEAFIRYAVSITAYRTLLIPQAGEAPRYLLPATEAAFSDPEILRAAPLYPQFRAILNQGVVVASPHLSARLHAVAAQIDADLPPTH